MKKIDIVFILVSSLLGFCFWVVMLFLLVPYLGSTLAFIFSIPVAVALTFAYVGVIAFGIISIGMVYELAKDLNEDDEDGFSL